MELKYPAVQPKALTGREPFVSGGRPVSGMTVQAFWCWGVSNVIDNVTRGLLAEFIVANAIGVATGVRAAWDAHDLTTANGLKVEVKSSAYLQAWGHRTLSTIRFTIRPTRAWNYETNTLEGVARRQADVYVLCLLKHQDKTTLNALDLDQWEFYVVPRAILDTHCALQKGIGLAQLSALGVTPIDYQGLRQRVESVGVL